jgi:hypothetical protein
MSASGRLEHSCPALQVPSRPAEISDGMIGSLCLADHRSDAMKYLNLRFSISLITRTGVSGLHHRYDKASPCSASLRNTRSTLL